MLALGEAIYTRALPILVGEGYDSLDKLPRTEERLNIKGKPVIKAYFHTDGPHAQTGGLVGAGPVRSIGAKMLWLPTLPYGSFPQRLLCGMLQD